MSLFAEQSLSAAVPRLLRLGGWGCLGGWAAPATAVTKQVLGVCRSRGLRLRRLLGCRQFGLLQVKVTATTPPIDR